MADEIRKYTIPLRQCYKRTRVYRSQRAINEVRAFVSKHMKVSTDNVVLEESINKEIWSKGGKKIVPKVTIETEKKDGKAIAWIAGKRKVVEKPKEEKKPVKKEPKKEEKPEEKVEEKEETVEEKEEKAAEAAPKKGEQKAVKEKIKPAKQQRQALQSKGR